LIPDDVTTTDEVRQLVSDYTREAGVRQLGASSVFEGATQSHRVSNRNW
jgi:hypothetical protein